MRPLVLINMTPGHASMKLMNEGVHCLHNQHQQTRDLPLAAHIAYCGPTYIYIYIYSLLPVKNKLKIALVAPCVHETEFQFHVSAVDATQARHAHAFN